MLPRSSPRYSLLVLVLCVALGGSSPQVHLEVLQSEWWKERFLVEPTVRVAGLLVAVSLEHSLYVSCFNANGTESSKKPSQIQNAKGPDLDGTCDAPRSERR
jgi:hypothetical protein